MRFFDKIKVLFTKKEKKVNMQAKNRNIIKSNKGNYVDTLDTGKGYVRNPLPKVLVKDTLGNVTSINKNIKVIKENLCTYCDKALDEKRMSVSAKDSLGIYYVRCNCGFVNKMINGKPTAPPSVDVHRAYRLFREANINFQQYAYTSEGVRNNF